MTHAELLMRLMVMHMYMIYISFLDRAVKGLRVRGGGGILFLSDYWDN